jgi:hypothetical protein
VKYTNTYNFLGMGRRNLMQRHYLEDIGIGESLILKQNLRETDPTQIISVGF